ncbi:MAG: hypothetical protein OXU29_03520, partial [Gammaproteobacteria bacterium]|nr:hypothetical protein [Gammaproteobacteria bacterium]
MRYCTADGAMDFTCKAAPGDGDGECKNGDVDSGNGAADVESGGLVPWFRAPDRQTRDRRIVFGHWASLGLYRGDNVLAIDTGCAWGGTLSAARVDVPGEVVQVEA